MIVTKEFLAKKMLSCRPMDKDANTVVILFGSDHALKARDMSPNNADSFLKKFIDTMSERNETIRVLKVQMFFQQTVVDLLAACGCDQQLYQKSRVGALDSSTAKSFISQALETRSKVIKQMSSNTSTTPGWIKICNHVVVQINNCYILRMGDLEGLSFSEQPEVVQCLADDFGSMTNEILRQSLFYRDYDFYLSPS